MHSGVFGLAVGRRSREMEQKIQMDMIQSMRRREQKKNGNGKSRKYSLSSHFSGIALLLTYSVADPCL